MKKKQILKEYEDMRFDINSSTIEIEQCQYNYKLIKKYFNKEIDFDKLMIQVDGSCPPNNCFWCKNKCNECDIRSADGECIECWRRCLEQEVE